MKKWVILMIVSLALILPAKASTYPIEDHYILVNGILINTSWISTIVKRSDKHIIFIIGGGTGASGRAQTESSFPDKTTRDRIYNSLIRELHPTVIK